MIGSTVGQHRILGRFGEGGTGGVHKAEDVQTKRQGALTFLRHHVTASDDERTRFLHEAQAITTPNHASVCTRVGIEVRVRRAEGLR